MLTFLDPFFWLYFLLFLGSVIGAFFIPGDLALSRLKLSFLQRIVLGTTLGIVMWAFQGYIAGYLHIRFATYIYLSCLLIAWIKFAYPSLRQLVPQQLRLDYLLIGIILLGTFVQVVPVWFTGAQFSDGLYFCCGIDQDTLYHLGISQELITHFPPSEPGMSGMPIQNYYYLANLAVADLVRVFYLPLFYIQNQYIPILISLLLGGNALVLAQFIRAKRSFVLWLLFFLYFNGDIIYLFTLLLGHGLSFKTSVLYDSGEFWFSFPRPFAYVILLAGINMLVYWIQTKRLLSGCLAAILFASLIGFKIYAGIFALCGLIAVTGYLVMKKQLIAVIPLLVMVGIGLAIYLPANSHSGGLFYAGFWRFGDFIVKKEFGLIHLELARVIFEQHNNFLHSWLYEAFYIAAYFIFVFGTCWIGAIQSKKSLKTLPIELTLFLVSGIVVSIIAGTLFLQQTGGANTSQFLITTFIISSIFAASALSYWQNKLSSPLRITLIIVVVGITIPRITHDTFAVIQQIQQKQSFNISNTELSALSFLQNQTDPNSKVSVDLRNFDRDTALYIPLMTHRALYIGGISILTSHGVDVENRLNAERKIFGENNENTVSSILLGNNINYLYTRTDREMASTTSAHFLPIVFSNERVTIRKVWKEEALRVLWPRQ